MNNVHETMKSYVTEKSVTKLISMINMHSITEKTKTIDFDTNQGTILFHILCIAWLRDLQSETFAFLVLRRKGLIIDL